MQSCPNSGIIAGRLISMRSIYLKEELDLICKDIQKHYESRLPALRLVALAAYEQLFNRQPLSRPIELRQNAIKYAIKYYEFNIDKLRLAEAENGLCPAHNRVSCMEKECPLHRISTKQIPKIVESRPSLHGNSHSNKRARNKKKHK